MATTTAPRRLRRAAVIVAALPLALTACGSSSHTASKGTTSTKAVSSIHITIKNFTFMPSSFTVTPGAKVTVTNDDGVTHTLSATGGGGFNTGNIGPKQTKTFTAPTKAGAYAYDCMIHTYMTGTLTVS